MALTRDSCLLLPGSLPQEQAALRALGQGLPAHTAIAAALRNALVSDVAGSWSDAERDLRGNATDLPAGSELWAAFSANNSVEPAAVYAIASPLSAALGLTDLTALDPDSLQLTDADSRALCDSCNAHLTPEGVRFHFVDANRWLLAATQRVDVLTERPGWLIGEPLRPNLPRGSDARLVERWMNELQMLLYTHPVNVAREDRGLQPINVVWLWGFSTASASDSSTTGMQAGSIDAHQVIVIHDFAVAFRKGDLAGWQQAWSKHATTILDVAHIVLGDTQPRLKVTRRTPSVMRRLLSLLASPPTLADSLARLQAQTATTQS